MLPDTCSNKQIINAQVNPMDLLHKLRKLTTVRTCRSLSHRGYAELAYSGTATALSVAKRTTPRSGFALDCSGSNIGLQPL